MTAYQKAQAAYQQRGREADDGISRTFDTGATRDTAEGKLDYEGFMDPGTLRVYAEYMHKHRVQSNGALRASDNWQKGIPLTVYMKSLVRHLITAWSWHRSKDTMKPYADMEEALCGIIFNTLGYLRDLRGEPAPPAQGDLPYEYQKYDEPHPDYVEAMFPVDPTEL